MTEYSSPYGVHIQPVITRILEKNGMIAYYYTGDSGSAPNRTFYNNRMISKTVIAFPQLTYRQSASFSEMEREGVSPGQLQEWLDSILDYVTHNRVIRLINSHAYDLSPHYPEILKNFILKVEQRAREGKLHAKSMSYFARYMHHFLDTSYRFHKKAGNLHIILQNPNGLSGSIVALPSARFNIPQINGVEFSRVNGYNHLKITENTTEKTFHVSFRKPVQREAP